MAGSIDDFAAEFGVKPTKKPLGLRTPTTATLVRKKKKKDTRNLRQKIRDRRKTLDAL